MVLISLDGNLAILSIVHAALYNLVLITDCQPVSSTLGICIKLEIKLSLGFLVGGGLQLMASTVGIKWL